MTLRISKRTPPKPVSRLITKAGESADELSLIKFLQEYWAEEQQNAQRDQLVSALSNGQLDQVMQILSTIDRLKKAKELAVLLGRVAKNAGLPAVVEFMQTLPVMVLATPPNALPGSNLSAGLLDLTFDVVDRNVQDWAFRQSSNLIVQIDEEMRRTIRSMVGDAVSGKYTNQQLGQRIARIIPLHDRYQNAVNRRYDMLVKQYVTGGMDVDKAVLKAGQMSDKYAAYLTRQRARTIARTETMFASNNGQYIGQMGAINSGLVNGLVMKEWSTAEDEDVCPICGPLDKVQVPFHQPFTTGSLVPPAHPNCRCTYNLIPPKTPRALLDMPDQSFEVPELMAVSSASLQ